MFNCTLLYICRTLLSVKRVFGEEKGVKVTHGEAVMVSGRSGGPATRGQASPVTMLATGPARPGQTRAPGEAVAEGSATPQARALPFGYRNGGVQKGARARATIGSTCATPPGVQALSDARGEGRDAAGEGRPPRAPVWW